jgi:hypothetical protein
VTFIRAFEPDEDYDHTHASDGVSRYGVYLAQHAHMFTDEHDGKPTTDPVLFAGTAWEIAHSQTMSPAYVRSHGRVQATSVRWDDEWHAAAFVMLAVSSPPEAAGFTFPWRRWTRDELGRWVSPSDFSRPTALTVLRVEVPLTGLDLPRPCYLDERPDCPDTDTAKQAVQILCRTLNAALAHVLAFDPLNGAIS